jgi:SMI1 / KNR4 family (SUKH-1)
MGFSSVAGWDLRMFKNLLGWIEERWAEPYYLKRESWPSVSMRSSEASMQKFFKFANCLCEKEILKSSEIQAASDIDIYDLQKHFGFSFPESYSQFLGYCGKSGSYNILEWIFDIEFLKSVNYEFKEIIQYDLDVGDTLNDLLSCFCIATDTCGGYLLFNVQYISNDPKVYEWYDSEPKVLWEKQIFSEYVLRKSNKFHDLVE